MAKIKIALVGNPNVGKSVIFNYLTGIYADVSNYPGTTIEVSKGALNLSEKENLDLQVIDTPGVYGISSFNDEEKAARDYILDASLIVNIVSAPTLERDLFLTKQICDIGQPFLLVLNQIDEAEARKVEIDTDKLSKELGVDVIKTVAIEDKGLPELKEAILNTYKPSLENSESKTLKLAKVGKASPVIELELAPYLEKIFDRGEALLVLEADEEIAQKNNINLPNDAAKRREKIYKTRRNELSELVESIIKLPENSKREVFSRFLLNPISGSIFAVLVLYLFLFQFLGNFVAGSIVDMMEIGLFQKYFEPWVRGLVNQYFPIIVDQSVMLGKHVLSANILELTKQISTEGNLPNIISSNPKLAMGTFLVGDYGVLTLTITYLYGLLLPLVLGFYLGLAVLEDSGYLPRLAVLVDGVLSKLGMNGRAIVPLILGGGCVTMATVTTRLLTSKKEKIITMALLGLTIPCSAQLGVIQGLLSNIGGITPWLIWSGSLLVIFGLVGILLNKLLPGTAGNFISDIPPLRIPRFNNIIKKAYTRTKIFMLEATVPFFVAAALVAFLQISGLLAKVIELTKPLISDFLLLPAETSLSFILGMVRRDFGAFGLLDIPMEPYQLITACLVLTLFVPCIATVAIMVKEGSWKTALAIWISSWVLAFGSGAVAVRILQVVLT